VNEDKKTLERMLEGSLSWEQLKPIIGDQKDPNRFDKVMEILQDKVEWKEQIILPLHEHLYVVSKHKERIVKCDCGYEFGDYKINWKTKCRVRVRDTIEAIEESRDSLTVEQFRSLQGAGGKISVQSLSSTGCGGETPIDRQTV